MSNQPEIIGEGEVTSAVYPDGSVQYFFLPRNFGSGPYFYRNNSIWFIRTISNPQFIQQKQNNCGVPYTPSDLPITGYQLKFHDDGWTSTTDLHYFFPRLRQSEWVARMSAAVQVELPTQSPTIYHYQVTCDKPCNCLLPSQPSQLSESYMSIDERGKSDNIECKCKMYQSDNYEGKSDNVECKCKQHNNSSNEGKNYNIQCKCKQCKISSNEGGNSNIECKCKQHKSGSYEGKSDNVECQCRQHKSSGYEGKSENVECKCNQPSSSNEGSKTKVYCKCGHRKNNRSSNKLSCFRHKRDKRPRNKVKDTDSETSGGVKVKCACQSAIRKRSKRKHKHFSISNLCLEKDKQKVKTESECECKTVTSDKSSSGIRDCVCADPLRSCLKKKKSKPSGSCQSFSEHFGCSSRTSSKYS